MTGDLSCGTQVARQPCRGFIHAGGILADALIPKQTAASLRAVFGPKVGFLKQFPLDRIISNFPSRIETVKLLQGTVLQSPVSVKPSWDSIQPAAIHQGDLTAGMSNNFTPSIVRHWRPIAAGLPSTELLVPKDLCKCMECDVGCCLSQSYQTSDQP